MNEYKVLRASIAAKILEGLWDQVGRIGGDLTPGPDPDDLMRKMNAKALRYAEDLLRQSGIEMPDEYKL